VVTFMLGLVLAIPLSIIANIYTPKVQQILDQRSKERALRRSKDMELEYQKVKAYADKIDYFLVVSAYTLGGMVIIAMQFVLNFLLFVLGMIILTSSTFKDTWVGLGLGSGLCLLGLLLALWKLTVLRRSYGGLRNIAFKILYFDGYKADVAATLGYLPGDSKTNSVGSQDVLDERAAQESTRDT
jgi:hypothetical protein